jgi:hypothetical protein
MSLPWKPNAKRWDQKMAAISDSVPVGIAVPVFTENTPIRLLLVLLLLL